MFLLCQRNETGGNEVGLDLAERSTPDIRSICPGDAGLAPGDSYAVSHNGTQPALNSEPWTASDFLPSQSSAANLAVEPVQVSHASRASTPTVSTRNTTGPNSSTHSAPPHSYFARASRDADSIADAQTDPQGLVNRTRSPYSTPLQRRGVDQRGARIWANFGRGIGFNATCVQVFDHPVNALG